MLGATHERVDAERRTPNDSPRIQRQQFVNRLAPTCERY